MFRMLEKSILFNTARPVIESQGEVYKLGSEVWGVLPVYTVSFVDKKRMYPLTAGLQPGGFKGDPRVQGLGTNEIVVISFKSQSM